MSKTPPKFLILLFRWFCHPDYVEDIEGDLIERFKQRPSKWLFTLEVVKLLRPGLIRKFEGTQKLNYYGMFKNHIISSFRSIKVNKVNSLINIIGFGFAASVCFAISLFTLKEYSYDKYHTESGRIGRLIDSNNKLSSFDYRVKNILLENFPEVQDACIFQQVRLQTAVKVGNRGHLLSRIISTDSSFFRMFSVPVILGNPVNPFTDYNSAILTKETSEKLFGSIDRALNETILIQNEPVTISAIIADFPETSSFSAEIIVNAENPKFKLEFNCEDYNNKNTHRWPFRHYIRWENEESRLLLVNKINKNSQLFSAYDLWSPDTLKTARYDFLELEEMYLQDPTVDDQTKKGSNSFLQLLATLSMVILFLAVINYVNLSLARQINRNKNNGIRKTLGASATTIFMLFITESAIVTLIATICGFILFWVMVPFYNEIFDTSLSIDMLFTWPTLPIFSSIILSIGLITGMAPAVVFSKIRPIKILSRSTTEVKKRNFVRNGLIVFQFTTSIVLIFCLWIVNLQVSKVKQQNPGFSEEQLVRFDLNGLNGDQKNIGVLVNELKQSSYIKEVSLTQGVPGQLHSNMGHNIPGISAMSIPCILADTSFVKTFGIDVVRGRNIQPGEYGKVCFINEAAYDYFEFEDLEDKTFNNGRRGGFKIIGVVNDFHFNSFHNEIGPLCILLTPRNPTQISIRLAEGSVDKAIEYVRDVWMKVIPFVPINYQFYDDWFDTQYKNEERLAKVINLSALLAIIISAVGILGLTIFMTENHSKEIAIRKVLGATISQLITLLNKSLIKLSVLSFLIACVIGYYLMSRWLENFSLKVTLGWWVFVLSGFISFIIAFLISTWHTLKVANSNPVDALRDE